MARRVQLNSAGMLELLRSGEVGAYLEGRMQPVLADAMSSSEDVSYRLWTTWHKTRVVARVGSDDPTALYVEATDNVLSKALDAAGGSDKTG